MKWPSIMGRIIVLMEVRSPSSKLWKRKRVQGREYPPPHRSTSLHGMLHKQIQLNAHMYGIEPLKRFITLADSNYSCLVGLYCQMLVPHTYWNECISI